MVLDVVVRDQNSSLALPKFMSVVVAVLVRMVRVDLAVVLVDQEAVEAVQTLVLMLEPLEDLEVALEAVLD